jgi:ketosteroid isomerase-like protein
MWRGAKGRVVGPEAIRAAMADSLAKIDLRWKPVVSRMSPRGPIAFTVGRWELRQKGAPAVMARGSYITVWRKTDAGWLVIFDTGRPEHVGTAAPAPETPTEAPTAAPGA